LFTLQVLEIHSFFSAEPAEYLSYHARPTLNINCLKEFIASSTGHSLSSISPSSSALLYPFSSTTFESISNSLASLSSTLFVVPITYSFFRNRLSLNAYFFHAPATISSSSMNKFPLLI